MIVQEHPAAAGGIAVASGLLLMRGTSYMNTSRHLLLYELAIQKSIFLLKFQKLFS